MPYLRCRTYERSLLVVSVARSCIARAVVRCEEVLVLCLGTPERLL